jgi:xanthine dehydrogenase accessory factor
VVGDSPIARAVAGLAETAGFEARPAGPGDPADGAFAVVIAFHGGDELGALRSALTAGVPFIGLVASEKRGNALLDEYGVSAEQRARIHTPVGLQIGAETPGEIALSILAQLVRVRRTEGVSAPGPIDEAPTPQLAVDPVCGMSVVVNAGTPHAVVDGEDFWFCNPGCRDTWVNQHSAGVAQHPAGMIPLEVVTPAAPAGALTVVDPVCGMTVVVGEDTPHAVVDGEDFWFCCGGCRNSYVKQHGGEIVTGAPG